MSRILLESDEFSTGERLDKWLAARLPDKTRSLLAKYCDDGRAFVNGKQERKQYRIKPGDRVEIDVPKPKELDVSAQEIPIEVVYEDDSLLVVNKPKGMVVHPAPGNQDQTLVNALLYHCKGSLSGINGIIRPGIVHRIDKDTSGLLIVAKTDRAHQALAEQIKEHSFTRIYEAVVYGNLKEDSGVIDRPIGRNPTDRKKMSVTDKNSRNAVTHYEVIARYGDFTYVRLQLETGRTHQIRVHMASMGHPVAGDPVYGPKKVIRELHGQCLHAKAIGFIHPVTLEYMEFDSALPDYFMKFIQQLEKNIR